MDIIFAQFGGDIVSNILWLIIFFVFILFYPRILIAQVMFRLENSLRFIENLRNKSKQIVINKVSGKQKAKIKQRISEFLEFFVIGPVSLDPFGIIKKLEHIIDQAEDFMKKFVDEIAPKMDEEEKADVMMGLSATISLHQIAKQLKHYIELIKKTRNFQLGLLLQMQLPQIERMSKALYRGAEALTNGWPVGDSIGPLIVTHYFATKGKEIEKNTLYIKRRMFGKNVYFLKAKGPGSRLGKIGRAAQKLLKKYKIKKIITIDAAAKLEGEPTGAVAEGVGVAVGGIGVDKSYIEELATKKGLEIESIIIKMLAEEAIMPMKLEVLKSVQKIIPMLEKKIKESKGDVLVVGVGNSCGIPLTKKELPNVQKLITRNAIMLKRLEEKEKKQRRFSWFGF